MSDLSLERPEFLAAVLRVSTSTVNSLSAQRDALESQVKRLLDRAEAAEAERDAFRAEVERLRAFAESVRDAYVSDTPCGTFIDAIHKDNAEDVLKDGK